MASLMAVARKILTACGCPIAGDEEPPVHVLMLVQCVDTSDYELLVGP